jgi:hypothetical protein
MPTLSLPTTYTLSCQFLHSGKHKSVLKANFLKVCRLNAHLSLLFPSPRRSWEMGVFSYVFCAESGGGQGNDIDFPTGFHEVCSMFNLGSSSLLAFFMRKGIGPETPYSSIFLISSDF